MSAWAFSPTTSLLGLRVVFCGTAVGTTSAERGHYYAGPGNEFCARVLDFGLGLTDLAKKIAASTDVGLGSHYDIAGFVEKIERFEPGWLAFHGKTASRAASRACGHGSKVTLGAQPWKVGRTSVFVLPSASAANRDPKRLEGKAARVDRFRELAALAG